MPAMQSEILFRGKRVDNGEWVHGSLLSFANGEKAILPSAAKVFKQSGTTTICCNECYNVDPATVGPYTGLTDKNGVKIFDGDIIAGNGRLCKPDNFVIRWNAAICSFTAGEGKRMWPAMNQATVSHYEIVGNIHDNPELLGGTA